MKLSEIVPELFFVPNNLVSWSETDDKRIDCASHVTNTLLENIDKRAINWPYIFRPKQGL